MRVNDFIFSDKRSHRLLRHGVFWFIFLLYFFYVNFFPSKPEDFKNIKTYSDAFELMIFFPISLISVYVTIYLILPAYVLTSRYMALTIAVFAFIIINFAIAYLLTVLLAHLTTTTPFSQLPITFRWFLPIRYGIGLPLASAAVTAIIKLLKTWHLKQKENEGLLQRKLKNEIQLLRTQFQPHFLYNTLKEISLLVQRKSTSVPTTLLKLSELLSYLLHEIEKDEVALEQEIDMMKSFLSLKKTFHEKRLTVTFSQDGGMENRKIAPLLLVSFVEDFFTKLIDPSPEAHSVTIDIKTDKNELYFLLKCQKDNGHEFHNSIADDWWKAALKKIEMLYPYRHGFETYTEKNTTSFTLILENLSNPNVSEKIKGKATVQYEPA